MIVSPTFLTAEWRKLAIANYAVDKALLERFLPAGTAIDLWQDTCCISLVGFMFLNTRLKGFAVPCHANFEEVNLRFYVRYQDAGAWKRGVVFIKEIVPRPALSLVANRVYKENYQTMPMKHSWSATNQQTEVAYSWWKKKWNCFSIVAAANPRQLETGSEEEFITEHYWGYTRISHTTTSQYEVQHPRWMAYATTSYSIKVDFGDVYGESFSFLTHQQPKSVMLAEGSEIAVKAGNRIIHQLPLADSISRV